MIDWYKEFPASVVICDKEGVILEMNDFALKTFEEDGGEKLIGQNIFDCHSPHSNEIIKRILEEGITNTYTIEKKEVKKLIHQSPYYKDGKIEGVVEISFEIPKEMKNFQR